MTREQEAVCARIGANIYGRTAEFLRKAEANDTEGARNELRALLAFFPKPKVTT